MLHVLADRRLQVRHVMFAYDDASSLASSITGTGTGAVAPAMLSKYWQWPVHRHPGTSTAVSWNEADAAAQLRLQAVVVVDPVFAREAQAPDRDFAATKRAGSQAGRAAPKSEQKPPPIESDTQTGSWQGHGFVISLSLASTSMAGRSVACVPLRPDLRRLLYKVNRRLILL